MIHTLRNHPDIEAAIKLLVKETSNKQIKAGAMCKIESKYFSDNIGI